MAGTRSVRNAPALVVEAPPFLRYAVSGVVLMNIAVIDMVFAALVVIFTVRCALRGFISELLSMAAVVLGLLAALCLYGRGGEVVRARFMPGVNVVPEVLAFAALFLIVFIAVKILERILQDIIEGIRLGGIDRFLGILFGLIEGVVVVCLILFLLNVQPLFDSRPLLERSVFANFFMPLITGGTTAAPDNAASLFVHCSGGAGV
jgi:membrane protein required for colicin V production